MNSQDYMKMAVEKARDGVRSGQSPFGAVIVKGGKVVANSHNVVWKTCDPTAHAEVTAIREASKVLKSIDLSGCEMYTTCEPCPMCLSAIHWSKIDKVYYGATIDDAAAANFNELKMPAKELARKGGSHLVVEEGPCREECRELFAFFKSNGGKIY